MEHFVLIESLMETLKSEYILSNGLVAVASPLSDYCTPAAPRPTADAKENQLSRQHR
jgi:hypothetical protein